MRLEVEKVDVINLQDLAQFHRNVGRMQIIIINRQTRCDSVTIASEKDRKSIFGQCGTTCVGIGHVLLNNPRSQIGMMGLRMVNISASSDSGHGDVFNYLISCGKCVLLLCA